MTKQSIRNLLSAGLCVGALMSTGCTKSAEDAGTDSTDNADDTSDTSDGETTVQEQDTGGDGDGDPGTTGNFVPDSDIIDAADCDPWAQDCPEGEKCAAVNQGGDTWNSNKCVPIEGTGQLGDECTYNGAALGTDDCDLGYICYYTNEDNVGSCIPLCTGTPDNPICENDFNCSITNDGSLIKCLYACDPILQDCAQEGTGCYWGGGDFNCYSTSQGIPTNEPCGYINDCAPGHVCLDATSLIDCAGASCCASFCDLVDPTCPIMGTECSAFYDEGTAPPGQEDIGVCVVPG